MEQFNNLIEFRQAVYEHGLTKARDAQFELARALLLSPSIRSFPELSLSPVFRRKWPSVYAAIEGGQQDQEWLEGHFINQIPAEGVQVFSLDGTAWPHPEAKALADRQYVYSGGSVVVGHPYSVLAWVPERGGSWAPPVSVRRVTSRQTATEVGVAQVKRLCHFRGKEMAQRLHLIVGDCKYGNHRFLGPLKDEPCGALVRMRRDRVLYGEPGPYSGMGRPRVHGDRFSFKEPETWGKPDAEVELEDERWGKVRLRRWDGLHARQDADTPFSVILVEAHLEQKKSSKPFWLAYQPPPDQAPGDQRLVDLWHWYDWRWAVEPSIRFRKQYLYWTLPRFQEPEYCDRWTGLVNVGQWELFLARDVVKDKPLPWQPAQERLTPERTLQSLGATFRKIGIPTAPPQPRGKSPGWPKGRSRTRPKRHPVVKKGDK
ncbi:MAG: transposase [Chloroflexota bacterium]|nr:transposase [Chloroflexota bacterium]